MNIAFITDNNYVMQTCIALISLYENKFETSRYKIFILGDKLTDKNIDQLNYYNKDDFEIEIIKLENNIVQNLICENSVYSASVLYKLMLDKILKGIDKILFLDSDIIVLNDLSELYNIDINNYYIAGSKDIGATVTNYKNKNNKFENYFNTGVMLLNLKSIRKDKFFEQAIEVYLQKPKEYFFPEQDVLNKLVKENLKVISTKYNFITSNVRYTKKQLSNFYKENIKNLKPTILHYAGGCRPWIYYNVFNQKEWNNYFRISPYSKIKLHKKFIPFFKTIVFTINQYKIYKNKNLYKELGILK